MNLFSVLDVGKTLGLKCTAPDTFEDLTKEAANDCREPNVCVLAGGPAPPADGGLQCSYTDTKEFEEFTCACTDNTLTPAGGTGNPKCAFTGVWQAPGTWPTCAADTSGGDATGGAESGGDGTGDAASGGDGSGGAASGGAASGGDGTGGAASGGDGTGGDGTGGDGTGGAASGGDGTGGDGTGGDGTGGAASGGDGKRRRREVESDYYDIDDEEIDLYDDLFHVRSKRAASANYIKVLI